MKLRLLGASVALIAIAACSPSTPVAESFATGPVVADAPVAISVPAGAYAADPTHASLTFKVQHLGLGYYSMKFRSFDATVAFDPTDIAASKVTAALRPGDLIVGYPADYVANHPGTKFSSWEDDLANSTNFLDASQFPTITFASTSVQPSGERSAKVTGDLTLKGVTRPVTLDVVFTGEAMAHPFTGAPAIGFSATGSFKRSDFGLDYLVPNIGDEVLVSIDADFVQTPAG